MVLEEARYWEGVLGIFGRVEEVWGASTNRKEKQLILVTKKS